VNITISQFNSLRRELPVIDVRSEGEFQRGHISGAYNIPVLTNAERAAVGTDYKRKGQTEAIRTGFRLAGPRLPDLIHETEKIAAGKEIIVYCWRGGMRSENFCRFTNDAGIRTHRLEGGYKSYRRAVFESFRKPFQFIIIGGYTGSGKSEILRALARQDEQIIDLEKLACHKGSVFGGLMQPPQPTNEQFQNDLFEEIQKLDISRRIWIEDESISIGRIFLPDDFWKAMCASPVVEIAMDKAMRLRRLVDEYGNADKHEFLKAMERIRKRLGAERFSAAKESLLRGDMPSTISTLLVYYDKLYMHGLEERKDRTISIMSWNGEDADEFAEKLKIPEIY